MAASVFTYFVFHFFFFIRHAVIERISYLLPTRIVIYLYMVVSTRTMTAAARRIFFLPSPVVAAADPFDHERNNTIITHERRP